jgi:hypothetical protein
MQETATQWDLRQVDVYIPLPTKLFILFLILCCAWFLVALIKVIWKTRSWSNTRRGTLINLSHALEAENNAQVSALAQKIPESSPEAGLRSLSSLDLETSQDLKPSLIDRADVRFSQLLSPIRVTSANLRSLSALLLLSMLAWGFFVLASHANGIAVTKTIGLSALFGGLADVFGALNFSATIVGILYVIHWRLEFLVNRREHLWQNLKTQVRIFLFTNH